MPLRRYLIALAALALIGTLLAFATPPAAGENSTEPVDIFLVEPNIHSVAVSADGQYIAVAKGKVFLYDRSSSTFLWNSSIDDGFIYVSISSDGEYIAASGYKYEDTKFYGMVTLFQKNNRTHLWNYTVEGVVRIVAISSDSQYIATGGDNKKIYLFQRESSSPLWSYTTEHDVRAVAISGRGEYVVAGSDDGSVYFFQRNDGTPLWSYSTGRPVRSVSISKDGEYIVAGGGDKKIFLFHKDSGTPLWSYTAEKYITSAAISANGEYVAASGQNEIFLFNRQNSTPLWNYTADNSVYSIGLSSDGEYITAREWDYDNKESDIFLFHKDNRTPVWKYTTQQLAKSVAISANGRFIVAGDNSGRVYLLLNSYPPTAVIDIISPTYAKKGATVTLEGHGEDTDGIAIAYVWSSSLDGNLSTNRSFSTSSLSVGYHTIYLKVRINDGDWSEVATSWLRIYTPPVTVAGENVTVIAGAAVLFNGTGSDEDGAIVTYEWDFDGDGTFDWFSSEKGSTTFVYQQGGAYTAVLRVTDNDGFTSTNELTVTALTLPRAFIDYLSPFPTVELGSLVTFSGLGRDDDGNVTAFAWNSSIDGPLSDELTFETAALSLGRHTIYLRVRDNDGLWSEAVTSALWIYAPPIANAGGDTTAQTGERVSFNGTGTDEDGSILNYKWDFDGDGVFDRSSTKGVATYVYKEEGEYVAVLKITDNNGFTGTDSRVITVTKKAKPEIDDGGIPSPSLTTIILLTVIVALFRRPPGSRT